MADNDGISRRHFFFGTLLAGLIPRAGFGSVPSLKALGYQSPNEKLNIAGIGAGGQAFSDLRQCETENIVALADVDWLRGEPGFQRYDKAAKYKDFRQMLDKEGKNIDAVVIGIPDHMHTARRPLVHAARQGRLRREAADPDRLGGALPGQAAQKYKVATQMGNQGYSHEATRVACEIFWAGEIGEVREVHAWTSRPSWPQGMTKTPPPTPVPATLDWDLWLGTAAVTPVHGGRPGVQGLRHGPQRARAGAADAAARRGAAAPRRGAPARRRRGAGRCAGRPRRWRRWRRRGLRLLPAVQLARFLRFRQQPDRRLGRAHSGPGQLGARS